MTNPADPAQDPASVPAVRPDVDLANLRPEVAEMMSQRCLTGRYRMGELFDLLKEAEAVDLCAEALASAANNKGCGLLVAALLCMVFVPLIVLAPFLGLGCLYFFWKASGYSRLDVPDDFRLSLLPVLDVLRNDVPPKARVRCLLDLRGSTDSGKQISRPDSGWQGNYLFSREQRTYYSDPWCLFQTELADGSGLQLEFWNEVLELVRIRGRKNKRKYKYKKLACVRVTLLPREGKFAWDSASLQEVGDQGTKVKTKEKQGREMVSLVHKAKWSQRGSCPEEGVPPEATLSLAMKLYSSLAPRTREGAEPR